IAIGFLYGLQLLLDQNDSVGKDQMDQVRAYRRLALQEVLESWKGVDIEEALISSPSFKHPHQKVALREASSEAFAPNEICSCDERKRAFQLEPEGDELLQSIRLDMTVREENRQ
ncbi:MAG: hypothetical protein ACE5M4_16000, partial [Anaerolineales bacterium]